MALIVILYRHEPIHNGPHCPWTLDLQGAHLIWSDSCDEPRSLQGTLWRAELQGQSLSGNLKQVALL